jgi:hypothetical protein
MAQTAEGNRLTPKDRARMCTSKKRFAKEGDAINFVIQCRRRGMFHEGRVYKCPVCIGYHVTSRAAAPTQLAANQ